MHDDTWTIIIIYKSADRVFVYRKNLAQLLKILRSLHLARGWFVCAIKCEKHTHASENSHQRPFCQLLAARRRAPAGGSFRRVFPPKADQQPIAFLLPCYWLGGDQP